MGGDSWVKKDAKNVKGKLHHKVIIIDEGNSNYGIVQFPPKTQQGVTTKTS